MRTCFSAVMEQHYCVSRKWNRQGLSINKGIHCSSCFSCFNGSSIFPAFIAPVVLDALQIPFLVNDYVLAEKRLNQFTNVLLKYSAICAVIFVNAHVSSEACVTPLINRSVWHICSRAFLVMVVITSSSMLFRGECQRYYCNCTYSISCKV